MTDIQPDGDRAQPAEQLLAQGPAQAINACSRVKAEQKKLAQTVVKLGLWQATWQVLTPPSFISDDDLYFAKGFHPVASPALPPSAP
jgi:hypothetical protein